MITLYQKQMFTGTQKKKKPPSILHIAVKKRSTEILYSPAHWEVGQPLLFIDHKLQVSDSGTSPLTNDRQKMNVNEHRF
jgi:hypothetical protein